MKLLKYYILLFASSFLLNAQTSENPWAIAVGADLINLQGDNVDSGLNFGAPALSLSRYISSGFSIGARYGLGKASPQDNVNLDYSYLDGFVRFNITENNIVPYLFGGYGLSRFADGQEKEGIFPSLESGRTTFGGIGIDIPISDQVNINVSTSYRGTQETNGSYNHLQHIIGLSYNFGAGDADGDGVTDKKDECPDVPGLKEFNGCPDTDGDGIPDTKDNCPEEAGPEELQGCPDSDGDGVADKDDKCPQVSGDLANGGCPDEPSDLLSYINSEKSRILFKADSSTLDSSDLMIIDTFKSLLDKYPDTTVTIEGHASSDGSEAYNQKLSEKRAAAVKKSLVDKGISADRLTTVGYGETKPVEPNNTTKGRARNRRVQLNRSAQIKVN